MVLAVSGCLFRPAVDARWYSAEELSERRGELQAGDVVIPEQPRISPHSMIIDGQGGVVSYYPLEHRVDLSFDEFLQKGMKDQFDRRVMLLRLKDSSEPLLDALAEEIDGHRESKWTPWQVDRAGCRSTHCAHFVWRVYHDAGWRVGRHINLDPGGGMVFPYQFIDSDELESVVLSGGAGEHGGGPRFTWVSSRRSGRGSVSGPPHR